MINLPLAFLMGFLGSLHCAVMCGPIMLSMPLQKSSFLKNAIQLLLYQMGRILTYLLLGALVGAIGNSVRVFANQQTLSLLVGSLLVVFTLLHFSGRHLKQFNAMQAKLVNPIAKLMGKIYGLPFWGLYAGMLNGLIPCGMVYLALATSLNTASVGNGTLFMLLFGLGTTPLMFAISLGRVFIKRYIHFNTNKLVPWFMLLIGTIMILRAADLGIPFLSPDNAIHEHGKVEVCQ